MDNEMRKLLEALDFNGQHSSDKLAAAYFRQAALTIRLADGDAGRSRHELYALRTENAKLRKALNECVRDRDELAASQSKEATDGE